jgi:hypothetical protein
MTRYLRRVKATMVYIIGENENDWFLIDANTAFLLQGLCPGLSLEDRAFVQMRMLSRELFPAIQDDNIRSQILERICSIKYVIITIYTFLEDTKYLEPCTRILKKVLPGKSKGSLSQYFNALHNGQPNVKVQTTESTFDDRTFSSSYASWVAYRVLWLLALRHFPEMDGQAPRKDIGKRVTRKPGLQPQWWIELSALALGNGYRRIRKLYRDRKAADSSEIEDCVRRIRPLMEQEVRRRKVQLIYQIIGDLECGETMTAAPELTSDHENGRPDISDKCGRPDISYRCGRPHDSALQADEGCLFFDYIYSTSYDTAPKRYLTSFAVTRDFFHSFFGTAEDDLDQPKFFRLPRDNHGGGREEERMQDVDDAEGPPANQRPAPPPPPEVPLPSNPTRPVENTHSAVTTFGIPPMQNSQSPDGYHRFTQRGRSASPTTHSHRSRRLRERSNSTSRQRRQDLTSPRSRDTIFPEAVQQLLPAERTQAAAVSSEDVLTEDMEIVSWAPPSAGPLVENAHTAIAPRSRSLDGRHNISARRRSASPTTQSHRSGRSDSTDRQRRRYLTSDRSGDSRIRDTIFPGSAQQLLPAGPPIESTQAATVSEDVSIEDMEMVPWAPPSAGQLVNKARTAVASRSRSLDGRRKITQRGRSTSPTIDTHRSERRRERSTSPHRERQRIRGSGTSLEYMEIVQWAPPPRTAAEPLVEHSHSATIPSVSALPAAQPSAAPIFSQEIRDRTFSTLPDIQLSAAPMLTFSEETMASAVFSQEAQSGTVSALAAAQPAAATMSMLRQNIQDGTISALPATQPSATPLLIFGQERLVEDITISLQDASRLIFRRQIRRTMAGSFMVFSPAGRDRFRVRKADPTDTVSMVNALQLPSEAPTITLALASDQGKRLKLAAPTTILEEARAQKLDMALVVSRLDAGEVVRQLEGFEEPGEELRHKEPQPSLTVNEIVKRNGKPIRILIWDGSNWKTGAEKVTYSRTEEKVRFYMLKVKGVRPYDCEGTRLNVEDCFRGAQKDSPPTLYLCLPEQASSAIEL